MPSSHLENSLSSHSCTHHAVSDAQVPGISSFIWEGQNPEFWFYQCCQNAWSFPPRTQFSQDPVHCGRGNSSPLCYRPLLSRHRTNSDECMPHTMTTMLKLPLFPSARNIQTTHFLSLALLNHISLIVTVLQVSSSEKPCRIPLSSTVLITELN